MGVGLVSQKGHKSGPNQDSSFFLKFADRDGAPVWMAGVFDGHGPLGHTMSRLAMLWLPLLVLRDPKMAAESPKRIVPQDPQVIFDAVSAALAKLGNLMERASGMSFERRLSGTTCVFALSCRGLLHVGNIGDSRAVFGTVHVVPSTDESESSRTSCGRSVPSGRPSKPQSEFRVDIRATRDHKPEDGVERQRLEAAGGIVHAQRVWLNDWPYVGLAMSRSLGDSMIHKVGVSFVPDVQALFCSQTDGDCKQFLLVASDGVWDEVSSEHAASAVASNLYQTDCMAVEGPATRSEIKVVFFEPGAIGIKADWDSGLIMDVLPGSQADRLGVKSGWIISRLEDSQYTKQRFDELLAVSQSFSVSFITGSEDPIASEDLSPYTESHENAAQSRVPAPSQDETLQAEQIPEQTCDQNAGKVRHSDVGGQSVSSGAQRSALAQTTVVQLIDQVMRNCYLRDAALDDVTALLVCM